MKELEVGPHRQELETSWARKLGPGLITGAADDDPSGIATYSQAGAQFGFGLLWMIVLTYPLMVSIQLVSARIGRVTGHGLATNIREYYPRWLLYAVVTLLLVANTINIAADVSAMGDALTLLVGGPAKAYTVAFGLISVLLQVFVPYHRYVRVLKWLTLALLAYVGVVFAVHIPWAKMLWATVWPQVTPSREYVTTLVAVFGTTISPYLFFWQASEEVEDLRATPGAQPLIRDPSQAPANLRRIKVDTLVGMGFSNLIAFFILLTTAVTLNVQGVTDIQTSAQAATALRPVAGDFAFVLFGLGIIGTGMLAIPVLAASAAYAIAGAFNWRNSLELPAGRAKSFYSIIAISTLIGVAMGFLPIDPIRALFWSAVINGVLSVPIMGVMLLMAANPKIMGAFVMSKRLRRAGWTTATLMAAAVVVMFATMG